MATIKSYTDLNQSKKLVKILPPGSADMWFANGIVVARDSIDKPDDIKSIFACWSLAALLKLIPDYIYENTDDFAQLEITKRSVGYHDINDNIVIGTLACNLIDACYKMILKLNELKLL